jgi:hypothetical protein
MISITGIQRSLSRRTEVVGSPVAQPLPFALVRVMVRSPTLGLALELFGLCVHTSNT